MINCIYHNFLKEHEVTLQCSYLFWDFFLNLIVTTSMKIYKPCDEIPMTKATSRILPTLQRAILLVAN